jgi:hypothetical protein
LDTDPSPRILTHDVLSRKEASTVARFIVNVLHADPQLTAYLQRMMSYRWKLWMREKGDVPFWGW